MSDPVTPAPENAPAGVTQIFMKPSQATRLYNPARDIAYSLPEILRQARDRLGEGVWQELEDLFIRRGGKEEDLVAAIRSCAAYVTGVLDDPEEDMESLLRRVGWFDVAPEAQVCLMAMIGNVVICRYFGGAREAYLPGSGAPPSAEESSPTAGLKKTGLMLQSMMPRETEHHEQKDEPGDEA